jgi:hypothetical protein
VDVFETVLQYLGDISDTVEKQDSFLRLTGVNLFTVELLPGLAEKNVQIGE